MAISQRSSQRGINSNFQAGAYAVRAYEALAGWMKRVQADTALHRLQRLDDRMLRDIGLCRGDLEWAQKQSDHPDPTHALQVRRSQHQWAGRKVARRAS